jgi:hypothetical protein
MENRPLYLPSCHLLMPRSFSTSLYWMFSIDIHILLKRKAGLKKTISVYSHLQARNQRSIPRRMVIVRMMIMTTHIMLMKWVRMVSDRRIIWPPFHQAKKQKLVTSWWNFHCMSTFILLKEHVYDYLNVVSLPNWNNKLMFDSKH